MPRIAFVPLAAGALLAQAREAAGYNCGARPWQSITVQPLHQSTGDRSSYTIRTKVPSLDGCDLTTRTVISATFPGDTATASITGGTLNGSPVSVQSKVGQTVTFVSPLAVGNDQPVVIVLDAVANPSTPGSKTLTLSATQVQNGSIGATTSGAYVIVAPTPTRTPTRTPTPTLTLPPGPTPTPGLCTQAASVNPCIPGGGVQRTDCFVEWVLAPVPAVGRSGAPKNALVCYEGDPRCDFDPHLSNRSCTFHLRACINNADPRLACAPADLTMIEVKRPDPRRVRDDADRRNLATLEDRAGAGGFGVSVMRGQTKMASGAANSLPNQCTGPFDVIVPLRSLRGGRVRKQAKSIRTIGTTSLGKRDSDTLRLECRPSTCGDGVVQADHEACDDGNRINGDGCNQACLIETPTPTPAGPTGTPTSTPTPTVTPTVTPSSPPGVARRRCTFRTGTQVLLQSRDLTAAVSLYGYQEWEFAPPGEDGIRAIVMPRSGSHFDPATLPLGAGILCARLGDDGSGFIDCNGGSAGYDITAAQDHNTTNPPPPGFAQDPECDDTFVNPDGSVSTASREKETDLHPDVCNSPVQITESGTFPPGGMKLTQRLFMRIIPSGSCPPDDAPFDEAAGDIDATGSISTGTAKGVIYNVGNTTQTMGTTGPGNGPSICGIFRNQPCTTQVVGAPLGCDNIDSNNLTAGKLGLALPVVDMDTIGDAIATLTIVCQ